MVAWSISPKTSQIIIVLVLTLIIYLAPTPDGLSSNGKNALTVLVFTASIFTLQPVSLPFSSLLVSIALVFLGVANTQQAFEPLSRPIIILILGSLFIAEAIRKHGVSRRLALYIITLSQGDTKLLLLGIMSIAAFLSMWMENTATAAVLIPIALTVSSRIIDSEKAREVRTLLVFGIAYAASIGGMATIIGSASNAVASGFLTEIRSFSFFDWAKYGFPSLLVLLPITWLLLLRLVPFSVRKMDIETVKTELTGLGQPRQSEIEVSITLLFTVVLWVVGPWLESVFGLPSTLFSPAVVGILGASYLSIRGLIDWEDVKGVSWGMFLTISAGLALGDALTRTGASTWLMYILNPLVLGPPFILSLTILVLLSALLTNIINNATVVAILAPILMAISSGAPSFDPVQFMLPMALATTFGYSLPSASGRMALISAMGIIEKGKMLKIGLILTLVSSLILSLLFYIFTVIGFI